MGYYMRGDYATGGYGMSRGDPGFLSKLWKGVKGLVVPAVATMIGGPIAGGIARAAMSPKMSPGLPAPYGMSMPRQQIGGAVGPMRFSSTDFYPPVPQYHGGSMPATTAHERMAMASANGCCPVGFHLDKRSGTRCVRNRRMNIANPRALRRAMRRVQGFEKLAKRTISFTRRTRLKKK